MSAPAWLEAAAKLEAEGKSAVALAEKPAEAAAPGKPRPRIGGRPPIVLLPDLEEFDVAWCGYSVLAIIPSTVVLALATVSTIILIRP